MTWALFGADSSSSRDLIAPSSCFLFFIVLVVAAIGLSVSLLARARAARRNVVGRKVEQIAREFPDEVRAWGGPEALRNPHTVRAMIVKMEQQ
jgi:hypothetical protein